MSDTKVGKLTPNNVDALREVMRNAEVTLTSTTATFHVADPEGLLTERMGSLPMRGHPRASLHAVLRKLRQAAG